MGPEHHGVPDGHPAQERLAADVAGLCALVNLGVQIDGQVASLSGTQWIIYGRASDAEETILASYDDASKAAEVLRAVPRPPS